MRKTTSLFLCVAAISGTAAAHGFNSGGGGHAWGASATGAATPPSHAVQNSNGIFAADRDSGRNRAEDRMSAQGLQHERATHVQLKRHSGSGARSGSTDADGR